MTDTETDGKQDNNSRLSFKEKLHKFKDLGNKSQTLSNEGVRQFTRNAPTEEPAHTNAVKQNPDAMFVMSDDVKNEEERKDGVLIFQPTTIQGSELRTPRSSASSYEVHVNTQTDEQGPLIVSRNACKQPLPKPQSNKNADSGERKPPYPPAIPIAYRASGDLSNRTSTKEFQPLRGKPVPPQKLLVLPEAVLSVKICPKPSPLTLSTGDHFTEESSPKTHRKTRRYENLDFYENKLKSKPAPGHTIVELLNMKGNYNLLDSALDQSSLQWLFPIPGSSGKNEHAQPLQLREIKAIKSNKTLKDRCLEAYVMMLDFYGIRLNSNITGEVSRGPRWENRYKYINGRRKHLKRITRILTTLGCFGLAHFQFPWIAFMLNEIFDHNTLNVPMTSLNFWIEAISDDNVKAACWRFITSLVPVYLNEYQDQYQEVRNTYHDSDWSCQRGEPRNDRLNNSDQGPVFPSAQPLVDFAVFKSGDFLTDDKFAILNLPTNPNSIEEGTDYRIAKNE